LSTIYSEVFLIATYKEFTRNSNPLQMEKVNGVADKFRSEYGAEISYFLF
jgi:hypothetical protein